MRCQFHEKGKQTKGCVHWSIQVYTPVLANGRIPLFVYLSREIDNALYVDYCNVNGLACVLTIGKSTDIHHHKGRNLTKGHNSVRLLDNSCPFTALRLNRRVLASNFWALVLVYFSLLFSYSCFYLYGANDIVALYIDIKAPHLSVGAP